MLAGLVPITSSQRGGRQCFFRTMRLPSCLIDYKIRRSKLRAKVKGTSRCSHAVKKVETLAGDNEQRVKRRRKLIQVG